jgi:hypothetical protein
MAITAVTLFDNGSPQIAIAMEDKGGGNFEAATSPAYDGKTFVVSMADGGISYSTQALSPPISGSLGSNRNASLDLSGIAFGRTISNDTELYNLSLDENKAESWSVIADIQLPGDTWVGPTGFTGHLYGNGHTIDLPHSKTQGSVAMFETDGVGAEIRDLILNVHTPDGGLFLTGPNFLQFGGFVGTITGVASPAITLENLKVTGTVLIKKTFNYVAIGGIAGSIYYGATQTVSIKHCVSDLNITLDLGSDSTGTGNTWSIGGFVGEIGGNDVTISDCYSTGNVIIIINNDINIATTGLSVGGFVGLDRRQRAAQVIRIERCYTASTVSVMRNGVTRAGGMSVGGIAGKFFETAADSGIHNCVTLGPPLSVTGSYPAATTYKGRIVGNPAESAPLSGNYALSDTADDGSLTTKEGLGVLAASDVPWAALRYNTDNGWDTSVTPPVLK